jgi:hypothetical protein
MMGKMDPMLLGTQALGQLPSEPRMLHPQTEKKYIVKAINIRQLRDNTSQQCKIHSPVPQEMQQMHTCSP